MKNCHCSSASFVEAGAKVTVTIFSVRTRILQFTGLCLMLLLGTCIGVGLEAQQDPFKRGSKRADRQKTENSAEQTNQDTSAHSETAGAVPEAGDSGPRPHSWREKLQRWFSMPSWFRKYQRNIQAQISSTAIKIKEGGWKKSWHLYALSLLLSIAFGFLHIAGPGHGKVFTISYFMSRKSSLKEGLWLSALINLVDSLSAGMVVFLTYGLLKLTFSQSQWVEAIVAIFSYSIIVFWGLWHLLSHFFKGHGCGHSHSHNHGPHNHKPPGSAGEGKPKRPAWYFALGIGLMPCPISTTLLVFGLLNQMLGVAIFLVFGVSLGGMVAMTMLSFAVIGGKKGIGSLLLSVLGLSPGTSVSGPGKSKLVGLLGESVEMLALILMIVMGGIFLLLSLPA
ncbi:hypothetical protein P0082_10765 [Candidatus Haliotispira prima]|uniref:Nickel/cobalt efflux system n=1 Tax=Candidatus Haliotispira prima TaxID=3034016 RepID=A0ABY8MG21_9SPIO|nr:hypothetical protein P0082_10765 [Candidatus Haliotispira prima]